MKKWNYFNYKILSNVMYQKRKSKNSKGTTYNDVIIMADTETSKKSKVSDFDRETYEAVSSYIKSFKIRYQKSYAQIGSVPALRAAGINASYKYEIGIDILYEDLRHYWPWIFDEQYSDLGCLEKVYNYLTEKKPKEDEHAGHNHVVAWTVSIRCFNRNLVTLYGQKPSDFASCIKRIHEAMSGDVTFIYFHNLSYDWVFLRKFLFAELGLPVKQLATKPHYPIYIEFANGIILKDSLILAQRSLEKWSEDMDVQHKKAVGSWNYDLLRSQKSTLYGNELKYIEHDTLAGVECLQKTMDRLGKQIYNMPYTATGIPREETRNRGRMNDARDYFQRVCFDYNQYLFGLLVYHGGFTHGNRHYVNMTIYDLVKWFDFASSYPFVLLSEKYPGEKFHDYHDCCKDEILNQADDYAFMFKFIMIRPRLKNDSIAMPALQYSKCTRVVNPVSDNGRILCAEYAEICITEQDLIVLNEQYDFDRHACVQVQYSAKRYLPRWFTDYVYECFVEKTMLKDGDPVAYSIAKSKVNSLYGMCAQRSIREELLEDYETGDYDVNENYIPEDEYDKYLKKFNTILPYQWGIWCTAYAFRNLFKLGSCAGTWLYSDTDSCAGLDWDMDAVTSYNEECKRKLCDNGYGPVMRDGKEYWLGVAELDKQCYGFKFLGAKRYAYCKYDEKKDIILDPKITVAGVPKEKGAECLKGDLANFRPGFIFKGTETGKLQHKYYFVDKIYVDEDGNETGDSIDLIPCDYLLDSYEPEEWASMFSDEIIIQTYEEE